jgi:hypothetical protein
MRPTNPAIRYRQEVTRRRNEWLARHFANILVCVSIAAVILFIWRRLAPALAMLAGLTGCVATTTPLWLIPASGDTTANIDSTAAALSPGDYWVEARAEELAALALPHTPDAADWQTAGARSATRWFAGPGLYRVDAAGTWSTVSVVVGQSLDDVLQTYDPRR